jgi:hypothetical protein
MQIQTIGAERTMRSRRINPADHQQDLPDYVKDEMNRVLTAVEIDAIQACAELLRERGPTMKDAATDAHLVLVGLSLQHCADAYRVIGSLIGAEVSPAGYPWAGAPSQKLITERKDQQHGFIYILKCPAMPGLLKIGMTTRKPEDRVRELSSSTAAPAQFELVKAFHVSGDVLGIERAIHSDLAQVRSGRSEFFSIGEQDALNACFVRCGGAA